MNSTGGTPGFIGSNSFLTTSCDRSIRTAKDGSFWSSPSSPRERFGSHIVMQFHHQKSILPKLLFRCFSVIISLRKYDTVQELARLMSYFRIEHNTKERTSDIYCFVCFVSAIYPPDS